MPCCLNSNRTFDSNLIINIVQDFVDVLPEDLLDIPPNRPVEFMIDLVLEAASIFEAPYRMVPTELQELKLELKELIDKYFIRPNVSPCGTPVITKKDETIRMYTIKNRII